MNIFVVILIATSVWVLIDSNSIGVKRGQIKGLAGMGPWGWFFLCLFLWIIGFPLYLSKRSELKEINSHAFQQNKTKKESSLIKMIVAIIFGFMCVMSFYGFDKAKEITDSNSQKTNTSILSSSEPVSVKIGDNVSVGNFIYKIESTKFAKSIGNAYSRKTADGIYLLINIRITNKSSETRILDSSLFNLLDESNSSYESSSDAQVAMEMSGKKTIFLKQCQPNIETTGWLVFEVPSKEKEYHLMVSGGILSGEKAVIKLSKT